MSMHTFADGPKRNRNLKVLRQSSTLKRQGTSIFNSVWTCESGFEVLCAGAGVPISQVGRKGVHFKWFAWCFRKSDKAKNQVSSALPLAENFQGVLERDLHYSVSEPEVISVKFVRSAVVICSLSWLFAPVFQKCGASLLRHKNVELVEN